MNQKPTGIPSAEYQLIAAKQLLLEAENDLQSPDKLEEAQVKATIAVGKMLAIVAAKIISHP